MPPKKILVIYHSQEKGNTRRMAELVAQGCSRVEGVTVDMINVNEHRVGMQDADAYALGSPDYFGYVAGGLKQFFDDILLADHQGRNTTGKPCALFLTHGGGGRAINTLERLAKACKLRQVGESLVFKGVPATEAETLATMNLGEKLAQYLLESPARN